MARLFDRNMFIMLLAIMLGAIVITYFVADLTRISQIETLTIEHETEIEDITGKWENLTNYFLQGSIIINTAREFRENGNYYFDLAFLWYTSALSAIDNGTLELYKARIVSGSSEAMTKYSFSYENFHNSTSYFVSAKNYTNNSKYLELLDYYINFAQAGKNITMLRYNASRYLLYIAENLTLEPNENMSLLMGLFNETMDEYEEQLKEYEFYEEAIEGYLLFDPVREPHE